MSDNSETNETVQELKAQQGDAKASRPWFKKKRVIIPVIVVALMLIGIVNAATGSKSADTVAVEETQTVTEEEPEEPAEPAVPAEYVSALNKAQSYSDNMHMSKARLYEQLTSEYGEQFSPEAAQYGVDNVQADWNANALAMAKSYQQNMDMAPERIRDQLTSEFGEKFLPEEADYAILHLND